MSYILEALKKADQERGIGSVPNLATPHESERPQTRSYRWIWLVAVLLIANVVLLGILLQGRDADAPATVQAPVERQPPLPDDRPAQAVRESSEAAPVKAPTVQRTLLPEKARTSSAGGLVVLPEPADPQNSGQLFQSGEEPDRWTGAATTATDTSQLPSWYELPQEVRSRLDLPRLDLHVYSDEPRDRFILVNLKKYREGERLESGLLLQEILPDGIILSYQGQHFLVEK